MKGSEIGSAIDTRLSENKDLPVMRPCADWETSRPQNPLIFPEVCRDLLPSDLKSYVELQSILSSEELNAIAVAMNLTILDPTLLGATIVVKGIHDLTHVPPSSRLQFASGAMVTIDKANRPCHLPAAVIDAVKPGSGRSFIRTALEKRGVTAWVERAASIAIEDEVRLQIPDQRQWSPQE